MSTNASQTRADGRGATPERRNIFVVDKDPFARRLLGECLTPLDCDLHFFESGYTALDRIRLSQPELVITEILVPHLDGLALCRLVKGDPALADVKVMVWSVLSGDDHAKVCKAEAFIKKPIECAVLLETVRSLIADQPTKDDA